jgi:hypothetical protein
VTHSTIGRSTVRIKAALVWVVFLGCWVTLRFTTLSPLWENVLVAIAMLDAMSMYLVQRWPRSSRHTDKWIALLLKAKISPGFRSNHGPQIPS